MEAPAGAVDTSCYAVLRNPPVRPGGGPLNVADDGTAGENDRISSTVENITGGLSTDTLTGSAGHNVLRGGGFGG